MGMLKRGMLYCVFLMLALSLSGCALLQIPGKVIEGTFGILGQVFKIIQRMPMPPPGVF